ncbi:GNAT family N-acetyltransferase [Streptomyces sp. NPDC051639]|uniref:GNAT family N-acetyltransferase n=1 Tax=Streptomyces sp. NPDC051639 TaxID=3155671 RepID=UPI003434E233
MNPDRKPTATAEPRGDSGRPPVRAATAADAEAITGIRSEYVLSAPLTDDWLRQCTDDLAPRLTSTGDARAFLIHAPDGTLAACALGLILPVLPAPSYPRGQAARVQLVVTHPDFRRRGYARVVVAALVDHLVAEDTTLFELRTSPQAAPLYRDFGFSGTPALCG